MLTLLPAQQNTLIGDFWTAVLQKSPNLITKIKQDEPNLLTQLWPTLGTIDVTKIHPDTKGILENILKDSVGSQPLNLIGIMVFFKKFKSETLETEIINKLVGPATCRKYLESYQTLNDPEGRMMTIVLEKFKFFINEFNNLDWMIQNKDFLKNQNLFGSFKNKIDTWVEDSKQLVKIASVRDGLELTDGETMKIRNSVIELTKKSADLVFIDDINVQSLIDKGTKIILFETLSNILGDKDESLEKRKKSSQLLNKTNSLWSGIEINDIYKNLKDIKKIKLGKAEDLKEPQKIILDSWGYNEVDKEEEKKT